MSNPFTPPGQPPASPFQPTQPPPPPPGPSGAFPGYAATPGPMWAPQQLGQAPSRPGNGLAITAIVLSSLALLGVIAMAVFLGISSATAPMWALSGDVETIGRAVTGQELERALTEAVEEDGGWVDEIGCPDSSAVGQGLVTVCHGSVDGWDWTGIVVFEDAAGLFTVNQL